MTYLVLDIVEELGISDFPITVRINKNTDERLLRLSLIHISMKALKTPRSQIF